MADKWGNTIELWEMETLWCGVCGKSFKQINNFGTWECVMKVTRGNSMDRKYEEQLIRSDHRIDPKQSFYPIPYVDIPKTVFANYATQLDPRPEALVDISDPSTGRDPASAVHLIKNQRILRYDRETANTFMCLPLGRYDDLCYVQCDVPQKILRTTVLLEKTV